MEFTYALRFRFEATNNKAKYKALVAGLRIAEQMGIKNLQVHVDPRLVANQVKGSYMAKKPSMIKHLEKVRNLAGTFKEFSIKQVLVEELKEKSIDEIKVLAVVEEEGHTWTTPIHEYLVKEILPEEKKKARAVRRKVRRYAVTNGVLYKNSFLGPGLRCVRPLQANYVLREIHEGSCNMHASPRSVVAKAVRSRIAITGPFPEGPGKVKFIIVAIDYFTKSIEAKPVATITRAQIKKFVKENIVYRFGLPGEIISDNEKQGFGEGIKARLDKRSKNWLEDISHVLGAHRTMVKSSNEETLFSLTYGTKAVIPRRNWHANFENCGSRHDKKIMKLWESTWTILKKKESRQQSKKQKTKAKMERYYNARVRNTSFRQETLSTKTTKQAMRKKEASSDLSRKDHMKSRKL
uniref:RNase H type-1 domain-containing protein n=1 Tax=Tanacetum cinerariifolium TaxID=118510 RepID=A0A699GK28_TANCI|nr:hypothetical protein [Tanacetum cinerariifolium]